MRSSPAQRGRCSVALPAPLPLRSPSPLHPAQPAQLPHRSTRFYDARARASACAGGGGGGGHRGRWCGRQPGCRHRARRRAHAAPTRPQSVTLHTNLGDVQVEVFCDEVPRTAENFLALCASGYYDGTKFHRCALADAPARALLRLSRGACAQKHQGLHGAGRRPHGCVRQWQRGATAPRGALSCCAAQARAEAAPASGAASFPTSFATR